MTNCRLIYSAHPSLEQARQTAAALVKDGLVACCNLLPGMESHYLWEEKMTVTAEVGMLSKTTAIKAQAAIARIREMHPYEVPEIIELPIAGGTAPFLAWIEAQCGRISH